MLPLRVLFGVALALATPECEVGFGYERRGKPSSTNINSFNACQATCSDHSQCAHFTYDYKTQECWLLGEEASLEAEVSSISGAVGCQMPTFDRLTETEQQRNRRIHRMIATMAGNVAQRSKDDLVIGVAKHMEYAARNGYLAEEKYDHVVVILNAAIADMDSGSIGRVTSYGHLVPTRDDLDWLLAHMEGIKGIPPRAEEMMGGDAHPFASKAGAYSAGGPWTNAKVKYCYDQYLSLSAKIALDCAMGKVRQELPGIEFINVGYKGPDACNTRPAIFIQSSNTGCWADIGMSIEAFTGNQKLNLGVPGCTDCGTAIHELLHSMGMAHEQSRPDRDTFVEIKWDNIISSMYSQFAQNPHADTSVDYDIMSIMHDGRFHWSDNGKETIVVKEAGYRLYTDDPGQYHVYAIGQHIMMTQNDVRQLAKIYNCTSNTTCGTGRADVRKVDNRAPTKGPGPQTDIFRIYQSVNYVTAAAVSLIASALACCCCCCSCSISQGKSEESRSLLLEP